MGMLDGLAAAPSRDLAADSPSTESPALRVLEMP